MATKKSAIGNATTKKPAAAKRPAAKKVPAAKVAAKTSKAATSSHSASGDAPWDQPNPKGAGEHKSLTPAQKATAKRSAKKAGRPYPNLVDNMHAAKDATS